MEDRRSMERRPYVAVLGGAAVGDRINQIDGLLDRVDTLVLGGGLANTFLKARGGKLGKSLFDPEKCALAAALLDKARARGVKVLLPVDTYAANEMSPHVKPSLEGAMALFEDKIGMDIGPRTAALFANAILTAGTVVWSGPMGMCELPQFERGTREIARAAAQTHADVFVCGGATAEAITRFGFGGQLAGVCADSGGLSAYFI